MESTKTFVTWRERWENLRAHLEAEPNHALAWRWRLEAKILRFLLHRYGEQTVVAPIQEPSEVWISPLAIVADPKKARPAQRERAQTLRHLARVGEEARATPPTFLEKLDLAHEKMHREIRERDARQRERERLFAQRMRQLNWAKREAKRRD